MNNLKKILIIICVLVSGLINYVGRDLERWVCCLRVCYRLLELLVDVM